MVGFGYQGLSAADNEDVAFRFFLAAHVAKFKNCQVTRFDYCCFHGFGQRAGDKDFRLLFWVWDCGSITEELLENFAQGLGIVMPRGTWNS